MRAITRHFLHCRGSIIMLVWDIKTTGIISHFAMARNSKCGYHIVQQEFS
jgi:hypothetical protein